MSARESRSATAGDPDGRDVPATPPAIKRMRAAMTAGIALVLALLGVFAYSLVDAQRQAHDDVEQRFGDVATVSAALTNGVFDASRAGAVQQSTAQFAGPRVDPRLLEIRAQQAQSAYIEVLDARGTRLAASRGAPARRVASPTVQSALRTGQAILSDVVGRGPGAVVEWAIPFRAQDGARRVRITGIRLTVLGAFMATFLARVPNFTDSTSVVVDSRGVVLGGSQMQLPIGRPLADPELRAAVLRGAQGKYGDGRYFAAAPIRGSPWRVAISTDESDLYASVNGSRRTVPWLLFGAFALAALAGLLLMRRSAIAAAELQRKEISERHAVEINDNIIQGLALASYKLERDEREAGSSQVADTLREAQRLVSELLGQGEVQPGQLRRETAVRTDRPPPSGAGGASAPSADAPPPHDPEKGA